MCRSRQDELAKRIEIRLLSVTDLVAVQARYHTNCRRSFEKNLESENSGRPKSSYKIEAFDFMRDKIENLEKIYTLKEFSDGMIEHSGESYANNWIKNKLTENYGKNISIIETTGNSSLIVLDKMSHLMAQEKLRTRNQDAKAEAKHIVTLAAKLVKQSIMNFEVKTESYPSTDEIESETQNEVPQLLKMFVNNLVKDSLRQRSISQAIFSCCKQSSIMPLQFALAVTADCNFGSKWLNNLLFKLNNKFGVE